MAAKHVVLFLCIIEISYNQRTVYNISEQNGDFRIYFVHNIYTITLVFSRKGVIYDIIYNNKLFDSYFMFSSTPSGIKCAVMCFQQPTCTYFSFNENQKLCMWHSEEIYIKKLAYTMEEEWNIYGNTDKGVFNRNDVLFCR